MDGRMDVQMDGSYLTVDHCYVLMISIEPRFHGFAYTKTL